MTTLIKKETGMENVIQKILKKGVEIDVRLSQVQTNVMTIEHPVKETRY